MPKVGKKKFSYTEKGKKAAKEYAKKTGLEVKKEGESIGQATKRMNKAAREASKERFKKKSLAKGYYQAGGIVEPSVPLENVSPESPIESALLESAPLERDPIENAPLESAPSVSAMDRSRIYQVGGKILEYKEGGKVDVTDVVKTVSEVEQSKKHSKKRESLQKKHPGVDPNIEGLRAVPEWYKGSSEEWRKGLGRYKKAETKRLKKKILKG